MLGRVLLVLVGAAAALLALLLLLTAAIAYGVASTGELDYGLACHSHRCIEEAWATFAAAVLMAVGTAVTIVLIIRGTRTALAVAFVVAIGYGLVGVLHTMATGGLLWLPSVTAGLLALGAGMLLEARSASA